MRTVGKRSPVLGYNHNFKHRGLIFHVQTEDSGVDNPHLFTHCFHGGVIISSRRIDYDGDSDVETVKSLMQSQHKAVLKALKMGSFDDKIDQYLGNKPDLLPRKTPPPGDIPTPIPDIEATNAEALSIEETDVEGQAPAFAAHSGAISLDSVPLTVDEGKTVPTPVPAPSLPPKERQTRDRVPTPIAVPIPGPNGEAELGDPTVTFNAPHTPPPPTGEGIGERSGTYSMRRPNRGTGEFVGGRARTPSRPVPPAPRPAASQAAGKSANPEPGKPRSSVVVSRPAVIIGAPPRMVGKERKPKRAPQPRKARSGNLFGQDMISEKSLDEVIMAYLSEDGSDES